MGSMTPVRLARAGALLIALAGALNAVLGLQIGALLYEVYPGGNMGHVGILAGLAAIALGGALWYVVIPLYDRPSRWALLAGGLLTVVLGHLGAIAGAIYVGTAGVLFCYVAGVWTVVVALRPGRRPTDERPARTGS